MDGVSQAVKWGTPKLEYTAQQKASIQFNELKNV
jgi:hypothetical protein